MQVISTFKFGFPRLTLKEGSKVKSDHIKRFPAHDFLQVGFKAVTSLEKRHRVFASKELIQIRVTMF